MKLLKLTHLLLQHFLLLFLRCLYSAIVFTVQILSLLQRTWSKFKTFCGISEVQIIICVSYTTILRIKKAIAFQSHTKHFLMINPTLVYQRKVLIPRFQIEIFIFFVLEFWNRECVDKHAKIVLYKFLKT